MTKPTRETIRKRVAGQRRAAAKRKRMRNARLRSSISKGGEQAAEARLERDGAQSRTTVTRQERNIPPVDTYRLMCKRINTEDIGIFCEKYKVNYDWLLCGDLKGSPRMTSERMPAA
jgi:hypothetical protein